MVIALLGMWALFAATMTLVLVFYRRLSVLAIASACLFMVILLWVGVRLGLQVSETFGYDRVLVWTWVILLTLVQLSMAAMVYAERRRRMGGSGREHQ